MSAPMCLRELAPVRRRRPGAVAGLLLAAVLAATAAAAAAPLPGDTGTYEITDYRVVLRPMEDGRFRVSYRQEWLVTGGEIPWITVGMANPRFDIVPESLGGNGRAIRNAGRGSWSGVRIELDRSYGPGETFRVEFAVVQSRLLYRTGNGYRLDFMPGWYDRAPCGRLVVELASPGDRDLAAAAPSPEPDLREASSIVWERRDLAPGERLRVSVNLPRGFFSGAVDTASPRRSRGLRDATGVAAGAIAVALAFTVLIVAVVVNVTRRRRRYGSGGRISGAGAGLYGRGCVVSCACACVACACACACAGGGAAGCDRKLDHTCPLCGGNTAQPPARALAATSTSPAP